MSVRGHEEGTSPVVTGATSAIKSRKKLAKAALRRCAEDGIKVIGRTRWVHGVLYDANDQEITREKPDSLGLKGLSKPLDAQTRESRSASRNSHSSPRYDYDYRSRW